MAFQTVFQRQELKYLLTPEQKQAILTAMAAHMTQDQYGRTAICSLYLDTDHYLLIRRSLEKPTYKEKLRIRSYGPAKPGGLVFVECKKKYLDTVYKRRLAVTEPEAMAWICGAAPRPRETQIAREIDYSLQLYQPLRPTIYLSYEREAYAANDGSDFRVTFDDTIQARRADLSLTLPPYGTELLPPGQTLMEIKCSGGIPLWMVQTLSRERIYKTSFSKYGAAYRTLIFPEHFEHQQEAIF